MITNDTPTNAACRIHDDNGREHYLGVILQGEELSCYIEKWAATIGNPEGPGGK